MHTNTLAALPVYPPHKTQIHTHSQTYTCAYHCTQKHCRTNIHILSEHATRIMVKVLGNCPAYLNAGTHLFHTCKHTRWECMWVLCACVLACVRVMCMCACMCACMCVSACHCVHRRCMLGRFYRKTMHSISARIEQHEAHPLRSKTHSTL